MALVEQWSRVQRGLPKGWTEARVRLSVDDAGACARAAALLGPAAPLRRGGSIVFTAHTASGFPGPEQVRRLLRKLDGEGIGGRLEVLGVEQAAAAPERAATAAPGLVHSWDAELAKLPDDWSDLYVEVELISSDYLDRAALDMAPVNPASFGDRQGFRFRCARSFGYGASPGMVRACLARCERDGIRGTVRILRVLSATQPVGTQGPVWYVGGRVI